MKYTVTLKTRAIVFTVVDVEAADVEDAEEKAHEEAPNLCSDDWTISSVGIWGSEGLTAVSIAQGGNVVKWDKAEHLYGSCGEIL